MRALSYRNRSHRKRNGNCCDWISLFGDCLDDCDNVFTFCLRNSGTRRDDDATNCPLRRYTIGTVIDDDSINFSDWFGVPDYILFWGTVWPVGYLEKNMKLLSILSHDYSSMQGSAQLYVRVLDRDRPNNFQRVDDIYVPISLNPNSSLTITSTGDHNRGTIKLSIRLVCWENFFGRNCSIFCQPNEHFTCGLNGERICRSDWQDPGNRCLTRKFLLYCAYKECTLMH